MSVQCDSLTSTSSPILEILVRNVLIIYQFLLSFTLLKVLGVSQDCSRHKAYSSSINGAMAFWEKDNTFCISTSCPAITALRFILSLDKGDCRIILSFIGNFFLTYTNYTCTFIICMYVDMPLFSETVLWDQLKPGYRHIFFVDNSLTADTMPISVFFSVQVRSSLQILIEISSSIFQTEK